MNKYYLEGRVVEAWSKDWEVNGKTGVKYRIGLRYDGRIIVCVVDEDYSTYLDKDFRFEVKFIGVETEKGRTTIFKLVNGEQI